MGLTRNLHEKIASPSKHKLMFPCRSIRPASVGQLFKHAISSPVRRATLATLAAGVFGQLTLLVSGIMSARILGAEGRGYFALYVLFPTVLVSIFGLGLPQALTFYISKNRALALPITRLVYLPVGIQLLVIALLLNVVLRVYQYYEPRADQVIGYLTICVVPGMLLQQYGQSVLQGIGRFRAFNITRLLMPSLYALMIVALYLKGDAQLIDVALIWVAATSIAAALTLIVVRHELRAKSNVFVETDLPRLGSMMRFGLRGLVGNMSPVEVLRFDQLIAGIMLSPVALGLYVVAQAFTSLPRLIGQSVGMIVYPVIAAEQDRSNNMEKVWRVFWVVCGINAPVTILLIVLMPILVPLFFGPEFESSVVLAQILLVGALLYSVRRPLVEGGRGLGFPGISTCAELSVYPWLLISAFLIIPYFGVTGLAVTVSVAFGFALLVAVMLVLKIRFDNRV